MLDNAITSVLISPLIEAPSQVVVVDDDSRDDTESVARRHGVRYIHVAHHNISANRNAGLQLARTPYVAFLDDDDAWLPGNMEPQLEALSRGREAFAYGIAQCADHELRPFAGFFPSPPLAAGVAPSALHLGYPNLGVVLFRREVLDAVGGFDPGVRYGEDGDLLLRIAARHEIVGIDFVGMLYRMRAPSRARADYYWRNRAIAGWWPRNAGVDWLTALRFQVMTRGQYWGRFVEDTAACAAAGHRRDALVCFWRALRIAPWSMARHRGRLRGTLRAAPPGPEATARSDEPAVELSVVSGPSAAVGRKSVRWPGPRWPHGR